MDKPKEEEVQVTKVVNMNLNQTELIEVLIEDLKEDLETQILAVEQKIEDNKKAQEQFKSQISAKLIESVSTSKEYKAVMAIAEHAKLDVTPVSDFNTHVISPKNSDGVEGKDWWHIEVLSLEHLLANVLNSTAKYRDFNYSTSRHDVYRIKMGDASVCIRNTGQKPGGISISVTFPVIDKAIAKEFLKINDLIKIGVDLRHKHYGMIKDLVKASTGEKRFKAKFIRASLGKSSEGKQILVMMDSVKTGIKLLK